MKTRGTDQDSCQGLTASTQPDSSGWIFRAEGDVERIEAYFSGIAFEPHTHDTYAIGWTLDGVQSFDYRGTARHSQPGRTVVLHPGEVHDGRAGTEKGFRYRVIYLEPALVQRALGGKALPFIEGGISSDPRLYAAAGALIADFRHGLDPLEFQDAVYDLAVALDAAAGKRRSRRKSLDYEATDRARQYIADHLDQAISLDDLERVSGRDRWKLSRDFRTLFGTSPYRYLILRRLDQARGMMLAGESLGGVAAACDFADQSHMTRHFKKAFGMTPKQWLETVQGSPLLH